MMRKISLISGAFAGLSLMLFGCTTTGPHVVERADSLSSTPEWASLTNSVRENAGKKYFLGYVEVDGDASKSAALNMADEKAMSEPMRGLVDAFLDQNQVGEELRKEASVGQRVMSATRGYRPPMPGLTVVKRYWETVAVTDPQGNSRVELRAFALAEIPVAEFEKAKKDYLHRLAGNSEIKKVLAEVGAKQRENVMNNSGAQPVTGEADSH